MVLRSVCKCCIINDMYIYQYGECVAAVKSLNIIFSHHCNIYVFR